MYDLDLLEHTDTVNELLARYGVKFGIYKNNTFKEQLFPFDTVPRIIEADEFDYLEKGLKQRVVALNLFLKDIYSHISGIDLVQGKDKSWYILEDNLRVPSGASYPMIAREICRRSSPHTFSDLHIEDNRNYAKLLRRTMFVIIWVKSLF